MTRRRLPWNLCLMLALAPLGAVQALDGPQPSEGVAIVTSMEDFEVAYLQGREAEARRLADIAVREFIRCNRLVMPGYRTLVQLVGAPSLACPDVLRALRALHVRHAVETEAREPYAEVVRGLREVVGMEAMAVVD